ncbi:hypothetical protein Y1Q_0022831 [Alligator mississippiensis]|uniref:Uncharacterized protein n=1 Tax=Alligator mississippiensis TaxID=8496 RepID=A0A151N4K0_ALLMI|nr:hypothetical protein Y1Q_0022831 [Alligator mississippiensis]
MSDCHVTRVYSAGEALSRFGTHSDHHSSALPGCRFRSLAPAQHVIMRQLKQNYTDGTKKCFAIQKEGLRLTHIFLLYL